jgi:7SK snRNA methylphosphate capping enzyme
MTPVHLGLHSFSISKWIHINGGDAGLTRFFHRVHSVLDTGGVFILEPQTWDTYGKAKRMDEVCLARLFLYASRLISNAQTLKETAKNSKLRPDDFDSMLCEIGFGPGQHLGTTGEGGGYIHVRSMDGSLFFPRVSSASGHVHQALRILPVLRHTRYIRTSWSL